MAEGNYSKQRQEASDIVRRVEAGISEVQAGLNQLMREYKIGDTKEFTSSVSDSLSMLVSYTNNCSVEITEKYPLTSPRIPINPEQKTK